MAACLIGRAAAEVAQRLAAVIANTPMIEPNNRTAAPLVNRRLRHSLKTSQVRLRYNDRLSFIYLNAVAKVRRMKLRAPTRRQKEAGASVEAPASCESGLG
ncbi:MAG: hypothetical protein ABWZ80_01890, partial [Beijerinckiaceae bacterium]